MGIDNIWVFAQAADGAPTTGTLELLTEARSLGANVSAFIAGDGAGVAAALGDHGAAKVYATGDLGGALPGVAVAAAMKAVIDGGDSPDLIMFPQSYEGRDVMSRLSVKLDRTVLTNSTSITVDGDAVTVQTPIFGGTKLVNSTFTGERPFLAAFRPKSFVAEGWRRRSGRGRRRHRCPIWARPAAQPSPPSTSRRPPARSSTKRPSWSPGGRGLGEAEKFDMIESLAKAAQGCARCVASDRRRRLGAVQLPGRPDRQGRQADRVHRCRHLRCHPAHGGHEGLEEHHRDQQGQGGADLRCRRPRHRR